MGPEQKIARFYFFFNLLYWIYACMLTVVVLFFFLNTWLYSPTESVDHGLLKGPPPTFDDKINSIFYLITAAVYWWINFKMNQIWKKKISKEKSITYWFISLFVNIIIIFQLYAIIDPFPISNLPSSEVIIWVLIANLPFIPISISVIGLWYSYNYHTSTR